MRFRQMSCLHTTARQSCLHQWLRLAATTFPWRVDMIYNHTTSKAYSGLIDYAVGPTWTSDNGHMVTQMCTDM